MTNGNWNDELLIEWILDPQARDPQVTARLERDPEAARRIAELELFLGRVRGLGLEASEGDSPEPLVERILSRTTREDLSWRGDLSLWAGYMRRRLSESGWMKVAAASLLVHLIALPALAFYVFVAAPKAIETGIIPWEEYRPADPFLEPDPEPEVEIEIPKASDDPSEEGRR
jgi:hypothetical protein